MKMEELLTTREVANKLRQNTTTIQRWSRSGILPVVKIGRRFLFQEKDIEGWVKSHKVVKSPKERLASLANQGEEYFRRWCKAREIDYEGLTEEEVTKLINESIAKNRKRADA